MGLLRTAGFFGVGAMLVAVASFAAPIRVGIFKGTAPNRYWHTNIHTAATAIAGMLANPDSANLGPSILLPAEGFHVEMHGPDAVTCANSGCGPTPAHVADFINALDSLDVVIVPSFVDIGTRIANPADRQRFQDFWRRKGVVSLHQSNDSYGTWPAWDSLHGTRFQNHPSGDRPGTIRLDSLAAQSADGTWWMLNSGLGDTAFIEEWLSFIHNGDVIRAVPGLKVLVNLDEASLAGGLGGMRAMGDHPLSWYRELPEGGRFLYTGIGHRANLYTGGTQPRFLRRQIYNAIVWAAGYNPDGSRTTTRVRGGGVVDGRDGVARISNRGGALAVSIRQDGAHSVDVRTLDGKLVQSRRGEGRAVHELAGLRPGVHVVTIATPAGRHMQRVVVP